MTRLCLYAAAIAALVVGGGFVGEAEDTRVLAFEDTVAFRLLLPAMSDDPA